MMAPLELRFLTFGCGHHSPKHIGLLRALHVSPPVWPETNLRLRRPLMRGSILSGTVCLEPHHVCGK
jgi:hypothetical protein